WCPHCKKMMPIVEQVKEQLKDTAEICQLDIDQNDEVADEVEVTSVPTFLLYKDGKEIWRQSGEMTAQALLSKIQSAL
ncbi:MAG: thioredoxin family protein, partial [Muribaculaceae bacterium]|nr:thioredoxin family protein [Muribaculaceae bacterium]